MFSGLLDYWFQWFCGLLVFWFISLLVYWFIGSITIRKCRNFCPLFPYIPMYTKCEKNAESIRSGSGDSVKNGKFDYDL